MLQAAGVIIKPELFLTIINIIGAFLGLVQGVVVARFLGPEQLGVIAVIIGMVTVAVNFVDVRLHDVVSRFYYQTDIPAESLPGYRAGVIQVGVALQFCFSVLALVIGCVVCWLFASLFTQTRLQFHWILLLASSQALAFGSTLFGFLQRFSEKFFLMGWVQLLAAGLSCSLLVVILFLDPTIGGYAVGRLGAMAVSAVLTVGLSFYLWRRYDQIPVFSWGHFRQALPTFRANFHFIFLNNFLGYAKLLHRSGDVLLVGFFTTDLQTGWYKLARTMTDSLYLLYDSLNKVYQPFFLQQLVGNILGNYRRKAEKLLLFSALLTLALVAGEVLLLPQFIILVFGRDFLGATAAIIVLTIPFFFVNGLFLWIWPVYLYTGNIKRYVATNLLAVITGQYCLSVLLYVITGRDNVAWFAVGYMASYIIQCPGIYRFLSREYPAVLPWQVR